MNLPPCPIPGHDSTHHFHRANGTPCDPTGVHGDCGTSCGPFSRCYSAHVPESTEPAPTGEPCCCNINCGDYCDKCHGAPGEWRCKRHRREFGDMPTPTAPDLEVPPDAPSLVTLPTVDQIAEAINCLKGGPVTGWHVTAAKAVLDLLAAHVEPAEPTADEWVRVDVDTMIPEGVDFSKTSTNLWRVHKGHGPVYVRRSDLDKLTPPDPAAKLAAALTKAGDGTWNAADVRAALKSAGLTLGAEK